MTGWQQLAALPQPQRSRAALLMLAKIFRRFEEHPEVTNEAMKYRLGFDRTDLLRWWKEGREKLKAN
jgi:hypothetical protein